MSYSEVAAVLEELREATRLLIPESDPERFDLDYMEKAVAKREHSIARLRELTENNPGAFTASDVEELQRILVAGKQATEDMIDLRREKWTTASEFHRREFVLKTFARFGADPPAP